MKAVYFKNKGEINPVSICTFGVNSKESDNPIGYFGTGLKYAIAIILREGGNITIFNGLEKFVFSTKKETIRGKEFSIIEMNGSPLGFTTQLGKNWKPWQAFRELYCNAADEDGTATNKKTKPKKGQVLVKVELDEFRTSYNNINEIILDTKPFIEAKHCDIHKGGGTKVFYKTILIQETDRRAMYTYNINSDLEITEDRTAKHHWQVKEKISNVVVRLIDEEIILNIIHAKEGTFEQALDFGFDPTETPSEKFLDIAEKEYKKPSANISLIKILSKYRSIPEITETELSEVNKVMLDRAIHFCRKINYEVDKYKIVPTEDLIGGIMGQAKNNKIYISIDTFGMGTKYLASTLIEEYLHLKTGYGDMSRELQSYLFNEIVNFGEQQIGEPV